MPKETFIPGGGEGPQVTHDWELPTACGMRRRTLIVTNGSLHQAAGGPASPTAGAAAAASTASAEAAAAARGSNSPDHSDGYADGYGYGYCDGYGGSRCHAVAMRNLSNRREQLLQLRDRLLFFQVARQEADRRLGSLEIKLTELEAKIEDKTKEFDAVQSGVSDRCNNQRRSLEGAQALLAVTKKCYSERMREIANERKQTQLMLEDAQSALETLGEERDRLLQLQQLHQQQQKQQQQQHKSGSGDSSDGQPDTGRQLKALGEKFEAQLKVFEDLEFKDLEEQSRAEEERELLFKELVGQQAGLIEKFRNTEVAVKCAEADGLRAAALTERELQDLRTERAALMADIERERRLAGTAEAKLRDLRARLPAIQRLPRPRSQLPPDGDRGEDDEEYDNGGGGGGGDSSDFWSDQGDAAMTSSGYWRHSDCHRSFRRRNRKTQRRRQTVSLGSDEDNLGQNSIMTSSLHEQLHGRFNQSAKAAAMAAEAAEAVASDPYENASSYEVLLLEGSGSGSGADSSQNAAAAAVAAAASSMASDLESPLRYRRETRGGGGSGGGGIGSGSSRASTGPSTASAEAAAAATAAAAAAAAGSGMDRKDRPLTRYLPSSDPDFNLRDHLLSLGHPLEGLRGQVDVTPLRCHGYLAIPSGNFRSWKRRWFVLDRFRKTLAYYGDRSETRIKGFVSFCDILDAYTERFAGGGGGGGGLIGSGGSGGSSGSVSKRKRNVVFCIATADRRAAIMRCLAPSPEAMRVWLDSVFTAAEGYLLQNTQPL